MVWIWVLPLYRHHGHMTNVSWTPPLVSLDWVIWTLLCLLSKHLSTRQLDPSVDKAQLQMLLVSCRTCMQGPKAEQAWTSTYQYGLDYLSKHGKGLSCKRPFDNIGTMEGKMATASILWAMNPWTPESPKTKRRSEVDRWSAFTAYCLALSPI